MTQGNALCTIETSGTLEPPEHDAVAGTTSPVSLHCAMGVKLNEPSVMQARIIPTDLNWPTTQSQMLGDAGRKTFRFVFTQDQQQPSNIRTTARQQPYAFD
jgi:hypothetical protein